MECYKINNLSFSYPNGKKALQDVSLSFEEGKLHVLCGKSGCGKTTLLRLLVPALTPVGKIKGEIEFMGRALTSLSQKESTQSIAYISQNTEYQIVTHTPRNEIVFALQNLGLPSDEIRLRTSEIAMYFSLGDILDKNINELSGGQKQTVCLAAALCVHPKVLILDEPAAQLDVAKARQLYTVLRRLCDETSLTVIIAEHRLQNLVSVCDSLTAIDSGKVVCSLLPEDAAEKMYGKSEFLSLCLPSQMRIHQMLGLSGKAPLTISQARSQLHSLLGTKELEKCKGVCEKKGGETVLKVKNLVHSYGDSFVLKGFDLEVKKGMFLSLMGENAAGKTTALSLMSGVLECKRGKIEIFSKRIEKYSKSELYNSCVAIIPQDVKDLFAGPTVLDDLKNVLNSTEKSDEKHFKQICAFCEIEEILSSHPYDVSGGELQRAALAMALLKRPKLLFADEPTKGMDAQFKKKFGEMIKQLCENGLTCIAVSHDTEFCAQFCDECAMIFDGRCAVKKSAKSFFSENYFYTTASSKIAKELFPGAVTESEVVRLCKKYLKS